MAFTPVADPLLDSGKPARSTDVKQMRDNQADHESRISALEAAPDAYVTSHFTKNHFQSSGVLLSAAGAGSYTTATLWGWDEPFVGLLDHTEGSSITNQIINRVAVTNYEHFIRLSIDAGAWASGAGGEFVTSALLGKPAFNFTSMTKPITFHARVKQATADRHIYVGLIPAYTRNAAFAPTAGIFLERNGVGGTQWRFSSGTASTFTNGTAFAEVAAGTWFEVDIIFTDDPSNQALCYVDGVLKETLTTNLPTNDRLYAGVVTASMATAGEKPSEVDIDVITCYADGTVGDAA